MICYYLDASAWVKRYCQEAGSPAVQTLFSPTSTLACATLGAVEVAATLARKNRAGQSDPMTFSAQTSALAQDWRRFVRVQLTTAVMDAARDTALQTGLRGADAVHLASAATLRAPLLALDATLIFVASDGDLLAAAEGIGITIWDPTKGDVRVP